MKELVIRFAGAGGHGMVFAGRLLGTALALAGYEVTLRPYYSPAQRGGWSKCDLVVSTLEEIPPVVDELDVLVVTLQMLYDSDIVLVKRGGVVLFEKSTVRPREAPDIEHVGIDAFKLAERVAGAPIFANSLLVGFVASAFSLTTLDTLLEALDRIHARQRDENARALKVGYELGEKSSIKPRYAH